MQAGTVGGARAGGGAAGHIWTFAVATSIRHALALPVGLAGLDRACGCLVLLVEILVAAAVFPRDCAPALEGAAAAATATLAFATNTLLATGAFVSRPGRV